MFGYMQSVTDKAVRCDSLFSRNWRVVLVPLSAAPVFFSLMFGQRSQDDGQILLSRIGVWAPSLRLAASFVNNRCRGGRRRSRGGRERGRESERDEGVGALTATPSRSCMDPADPRACAQPSSSPARRTEGAQKKLRGLVVVDGGEQGGTDSRK